MDDIPSKVKKAAELLAADDTLTVAAAAKEVGMSDTTLARRLRSENPLAATHARPSDVMEAVAKLVS